MTSRPQIEITQAMRWPEDAPPRGRKPSIRQRLQGVLWPLPGQWLVRVRDEANQCAIDVELLKDEEGRPVITGIAVRVLAPLEKTRSSRLKFAKGYDVRPLSARRIKRLPLSTWADVAVALTSDPGGHLVAEPSAEQIHARRLIAGEDQAGRGKGAAYYVQLGKEIDELLREGVTNPIPEIANRRGEDVNTIHQQVYRGRGLELIPPSARSAAKKKPTRRAKGKKP